MEKIMIETAAYYSVAPETLRQAGIYEIPRYVAAYLGEKAGVSPQEVGDALGMSPLAAHLAAKAIARKCAGGQFPSVAQDVVELEARLVGGAGTSVPDPQFAQRNASWSGTASRVFSHVPHAPSHVPYAADFGPCPGSRHRPARMMSATFRDPAMVEVDASYFRTHRFAIDALNIAYLGNGHKKGNHPVLANVIALTRELDRRGAEWMCFWDPFNPNRFVKPGEARRWEQLMHGDPQRQIQVEGMKADLAVLMYASKPTPSGLPAMMVTDDQYRDHAAALNFPIASDKSRFLCGTKVGNELWFPSIQWWITVA